MNSKDRKARAEAVRALRGKGIGVPEAWLLRGKFGFHEQQVIAP